MAHSEPSDLLGWCRLIVGPRFGLHRAAMVMYRRNRVPGGMVFFTATLADRTSHALVDHIDALRAAYRGVHARHSFETIAMVVMPDHLHAIWRLPPGDDRYSMRWRLIKTMFTARLLAAGVPIVRRTDGRRLWARRFWEHTIRDERDLATHVDYIHFNPVKHGYVAQVADWPYSTFHRAVVRGEVARDWGVAHGASGAWGERGG